LEEIMKKILCMACAVVILSASSAFGACTAEDFQKEVLAMQTSLVALANTPEKLAEVNAALEKEFNPEVLEFSQLAQNANGDAVKTQEMLDKGCDLYSRMNKKIDSLK
jgi:NADP-dependent 3-hydroxy acid dehydrogenase YdfG